MFTGLFSYSDAAPPAHHLSLLAKDQVAAIASQAPASTGPAVLLDAATVCPDMPPGLSEMRCCPTSGRRVAFWGRLDERAALASRLGLPTAQASPPTAGELLLAAWERWGDKVACGLVGDFAAVLIDPDRHRMLLLRDPLGTKPFYYLQRSWGVAFGSSAAAVKALLKEPLRIDERWVKHFLAHASIELPCTAYEGLCRLPPGHQLAVEANAVHAPSRWHRWKDDPPPARKRDAIWVERYLSVLEEAVRCRMPAQRPMATENSGGLDSAAVTALLARNLASPAEDLLSVTLAMRELEPPFAMALSRRYGIAHNYMLGVLPTDPSDATVMRSLSAIGYPEEHGMGFAHDLLYQQCLRHGAHTLFSGFGGDEAASHRAAALRYELRDSQQWANLHELAEGPAPYRLLRWLKAIATGLPSPRENPAAAKHLPSQWQQALLRPDASGYTEVAEAFDSGRLHGVGLRRINDAILATGLKKRYVSARLEACTLTAASYGIEYQWPLLDARVIQQYLSTPSIEKMGPNGIERYLHRRAIAPLVPAEIAWKRDKDMGKASLLQVATTVMQQRQAKLAVALDADLHPMLAELIDRTLFRQQIARARLGGQDLAFSFMFKHNVRSLRWLDMWLKTHDAAAT